MSGEAARLLLLYPLLMEIQRDQDEVATLGCNGLVYPF